VSFNYEHIDAPSDAEFITKALNWLIERIRSVTEARGDCIIGLSGGATPAGVYKQLGRDTSIAWDRVKVFLVDERYVPADHKNSNQRLVRQTLLLNAQIPEENLVFPDATQPLAHCIDTYAQRLAELLQENPPDLVVLGMGPDGHIASLFPPVPKEAFGEVMVLHTTTDLFPEHDRITVSPLVIMSAQAHLLLLRGSEKKQMLEEMLRSDMNPVRWPMHIPLSTQRTTVILDPTGGVGS